MPDIDNRTADLVLFAPDPAGVRHVLLITRGGSPFKGRRALPGGYLDEVDGDGGDTSRVAAAREALEETGIDLPVTELRFLGTWDALGRDPRGPVSTDAYTAQLAAMPRPVAGDDAAKAEWVPVIDALAETLAFDHNDILAVAVSG